MLGGGRTKIWFAPPASPELGSAEKGWLAANPLPFPQEEGLVGMRERRGVAAFPRAVMEVVLLAFQFPPSS